METFQNRFTSELISMNDIINLLRNSIQQQYNAKQLDIKNETIEKNVRILFEQDYVCQYISNTNGELSLAYPSQILVPIIDKWSEVQTPKITPSINIRDCCVRSRIARCRSRLVVPTLFIDGKYICRSATLSSWGEIYPRLSMDLLVDAGNRRFAQPAANIDNAFIDIEQPQQRTIFDKLRSADVDLLNIFDIGSIVNLMVQQKNILFGMKITASEKFDKHDRYRTFQMILLPYPGCEHFREVAIQKYNGEFMFYDWSLSKNDALLDVPIHLASRVNTDWLFWRSWNTIQLTQNYFQILLRHLETEKRGILIHCLSGWDRTPLFISLLRLSLWADGFIHQSLTVEEILYLTLAYDWYLFGHNLPERLPHGEEILYFTFMVLPYLVGDEFVFQSSNTTRHHSTLTTTGISCNYMPERHVYNNNTSCVNVADDSVINVHRNPCQYNSIGFEENKKTIRKEKLLAVFHLFHTCYRTVIPKISTTLNNGPPPVPDMARRIKNFVLQRRS
ncbi:unnamed protein product [Rotaria sordida]|uniref:Myotubularin phosphatase domain-containing protein n=1 Tax=Rotaria sordida TaxID=392033 RepID=A0A814IH15_9BILA|nr:unnamed protein product [Rotaria sordida]CAF1202246.1 unnamed protein product [Rotaria sordida]